MVRLRSRAVVVAAALLAGACSSESIDPAPIPRGAGPRAPDVPAQSAAQRLSAAQYENAIHDLFDDEVVVPEALEPDTSHEGLVAIGSSISSVSPKGVEQYEDASFEIAKQVVGDAARLTAILPCVPESVGDVACARQVIQKLGRRAWRRPLTWPEIDKLALLVAQAGASLGSFEQGVEFGVAALLQSPHFLYRPARGELDPDRPGLRRYTSWEMASRLSFFLYNGPPDDELLDAAEAGLLVTDAGLAAQATRMLDSPRARRGLANFVTEWLRLDMLDSLSKDPTVFTYFSPEVGPAAREETLRVFEDLVFERDGSYLDVLLTRRTFVNPKLASMYQVAAPSPDGFGEVVFPEDSPRVGLLGHVSILSLYSHPTSSSATLRGKFVRNVLLCDVIPPPPVDVNTGLPEPSPEAPTLRERVKAHLENEFCAACHLTMDPIGLGLENFDSIGRWRLKENDAVIDASGLLDGVPFANPRELALAIHDSPKVGPCFAKTMFHYATGFTSTPDDKGTIDALAWDFESSGFRIKSLMRSIVMTPGFRLMGPTK